ncbi:MAG: FtsW/RodA/SpoVE family cell cycle protein [Velocimicrobium sp.]
MREEEYLQSLTEQIRCKAARDVVLEEVKNHIEDQAELFRNDGMEEKEARQAAVIEMGDPVEVGVSLDRIHRPKAAWKILFMIGIISIIGLVIQYAISAKEIGDSSYKLNFIKQCGYTGIGIAIMMVVYFMDYSIIGKYAKPIGAIICIFLFMNTYFFGISVNGARTYISIGEIHVSMAMLMYLYVPIYGGILYQYRGEGYKAIGKSIVWLLIPAFIALYMPRMSLSLNLCLILAVMLSIAILKGWYCINKKITLVSIWGIMIAFPVTMAINSRLYQAERLKAVIDPSSSEVGYITKNIRDLLKASQLLGANTQGLQTYGILPDINCDYILIHVFSYYGVLAAGIIILLMALLVIKIFKVSFHQKNQLGMMMGCGCGLAFAIQSIIYMLQNMGLFPITSVYLPLFSFSGTGTIVTYCLLGILLSIYRYQNILFEKSLKGKSGRAKLYFSQKESI